MKFKRMSGAALALSAAMLLSACGNPTNAAEVSAIEQASVQTASALPDAAPVDASATEGAAFADSFSNRDLSGTYDASGAVRIALDGASASSDSDAVKVSGSVVTIAAAGTYLLSGTLDNGTVIVDAGKEDKVQIVLHNASIHSDTFAALYVRQADKVFVTLADGSVNALSNGGTFESIDDNSVDGAVFSKDDLTFNGNGKLTVTSPAKHGVVCKDDLVIAGGAYEIAAASCAVSGKDSVSVAGGSLALTAGKDGIHAENSEDAEKGNVYVTDGSFQIAADGDGVSASGALRVDGGAFAVKAGGGTQNAKNASDESRKGLKADGNLIFNGGTFAIDAADDGIHSNADIQITAGTYAISSGDDGIHADGLAEIDGGTLDINAYEGMEGTYVRINDGAVKIDASDDGINAARKSSVYSPTVEINGGEVTVTVGPGDTDGIDSDGALIITGGTIRVNGNSAFDYDGALTFSGGAVIVNGQQVDTIPNQMMGGRGGRGNMGGMGGNFGARGGRTFEGSGATPDGNAENGVRGGGMPDGNAEGAAPDGNAENGVRQWGGRGGKGRKADGTVTGDASATPNGRAGKSQKQSELPDAVTTPTQKIAPI